MWSWRLSKIKSSITKAQQLADAQDHHSAQSSDVLNNQSAYFFTKIGRWQHLIELFAASSILAVVLMLAEAGTWQAMNWGHVLQYLLYIYWVILVFIVVIQKIQPKINHLNHVVVFTFAFFLLQGIVLLTTIFLNALLLMLHFGWRQLGDWQQLFDHAGLHLSYGVLMGAFSLRYLYIRDQWLKQQHSELQARIQAMQARIQPHFLFNSLNSVVSLIAVDPDKAEDMLINLSRLFRVSLQELKLVSLAEELQICRQYIAIEQIRLRDRLQMDWRLPDIQALQYIQIPVLSLQPLLENSIFHGVEKISSPCKISLLVEILDRQVNIVITNPYLQEQQGQRQGNGIALENVKQRLRAYYGDAAYIQCFAGQGIFTTILTYPYQ
ncbi:sensor histidine kinase [Acinetobacter brisouii]|jgi:two-component system sensor histidine kinase AlgZ|uniref:sensor histidine kinase n=1 Tax=Acinetobacter brisouii TaxID=396323 RepID=UPI0005F88C1A|nr:histidine kinase [Acinetobacter brisouii]KJV39869.1 alginate biosynthesis protein [Acinetobacter brisouii]